MLRRMVSVVLAILLLAGILCGSASAETAADGAYTDEAVGASFTVPEGWSYRPPQQDGSGSRAVFRADDIDNVSVAYSVFDVLASDGESGASGDRAAFDNAAYLERNPLEQLEASYTENAGSPVTAETVTCGGNEYIRRQGQFATTGARTSFSIDSLVKNGYEYQFTYYGPLSGKYFEAYEELLASAFLTGVISPELLAAETPEEDTKGMGNFILFLIGAALLGLLTFTIRYLATHRKRKPY